MASNPSKGITPEEYGKEWMKNEPFAKVCPLYSFGLEDGIVYLSDFTMGMSWLVEPIGTTSLTGQEKAFIANTLSGMMSNLPSGSRYQFIMNPTRDVEKDVENYLSHGGTKNSIMAEVEKAKVDFYRKGVNGLGIRSGDLEYTIKSHRMLVTLVIPAPANIGEMRSTARDALKAKVLELDGRVVDDAGFDTDLSELPSVERWEGIHPVYKKELLTAANTIESAFSSVKPAITFRRCRKNEFLSFYQSITQLTSGVRSKSIYNPSEPLPEQLMRTEVRFRDDGLIYCDGYYHGVMTIDDYPSETFAGMMSEAHPSLGMNSLLDFITGGTIVISCFNEDKQKVDDWNSKKFKLATEGEGDPIERGVIVEESRLIRQWTKTEGRRMVDGQISICIADKEPHIIRNRLSQIRAKLMEMGFRARIEESAAPMFWAQQLPFGWKPSLDGPRRTKRRLDLIFANLLPMYLTSRGTTSKAVMFLNERGEPVGADFFESPSAFNYGIVAESGGGKSVLQNVITSDYARKDNFLIALIDIGGSYKPLVSSIGEPDAKEYPLTRSNKTSFNPFDGVFEIAAPGVMEWIQYLAMNTDQELDQLIKGKAEGVLRETFRQKLKENVPYKNTQELLAKYVGFHIARQAKRLRIKQMEEEDLKAFAEDKASQSEGVNGCNANVFHEIRIHGSSDKKNQRDRLSRITELSVKERNKLRREFAYLEDDDNGVYVLALDPNSVQSLEFDGYECSLVSQYLVAEAADAKDWLVLSKRKVKVIFDDEYLTRKRNELADALEEKYGKTGNAGDLQALLDDEIENLDSTEYFAQTIGKADLQEQVFFREFGAACLATRDPDLVNLATRLAPFYGDGAYAGYFDRPSQVKLEGRKIVVFDFEDLFKGDVKLVGAVLGALCQFLTNYFTSPRKGGGRILAFFDELAKFQEIPRTNKFVNLIQRQGRKYGFGVGVGTQSVNDLNHRGCNLLEHMQHLFIGPQLDSTIRDMKDTLGFNSVQRARVSSLAGRKGVFSEFILYIPRTRTFEKIRVILTNFTYWMFTTDPPDKELRKTLKQKYALEVQHPRDAMVRAIRECARLYPNGIAYDLKQKLK